jgi:hypothetical protein
VRQERQAASRFLLQETQLSPAQQKYSAYDRKLPAIFEAVKHFRHMLEARHFIIFTDHKPFIYAFQQKWGKCSPRQLII